MDTYAIVDVDGCQCKVTTDEVVRIPLMEAEVGSDVSFDKVMLLSNGQEIQVGTPYVEGKSVKAEIIRHGKEKKVIVFKKKRRKDYRRTNGHRQGFTEVLIKTFAG